VRGTIVLGIIVMLAVTLVPTVRSLIQQRGETIALEAKVAEQKQAVQRLQREAELWKDPAYIEVQARKRLKFVRVGDRAYSVIGAEKDEPESELDRPVVAAPMANEAAPWYGKLWQSIQIADRPTAGLPATK
jgi:cell division protein FtsB